jgi:hypothetical protein
MCLALPAAVEHQAWTGTSWRVRTTTFAHVVQIADGRPPAYALAFATSGPATVVTFQACLDEYVALAQHGPPFHTPAWRPGIIGVELGNDTDWDELRELITDSHHLCKTGGRGQQRDPRPVADTDRDSKAIDNPRPRPRLGRPDRRTR